LENIFSIIKNSLDDKGYFIFTIELSKIDIKSYQLSKNGRFSHTINYIETLCKKKGFKLFEKEKIILREENKVGQEGVIFILDKSL
jgi:predicted TPR repeat methyltransferase